MGLKGTAPVPLLLRALFHISCYPTIAALRTSKKFAPISSIKQHLQKLSTGEIFQLPPQIKSCTDYVLDFLTLFFSLVEFQGDKLAGLGVQVPWQEWAEICNQEKHNQEHTSLGSCW